MLYVAVYRKDVIVGLIPFHLAPRLSAFLRRDVNNSKCLQKLQEPKRTGEQAMVLRYHIPTNYGPKVYIDRMKELVDSLLAAGLSSSIQ